MFRRQGKQSLVRSFDLTLQVVCLGSVLFWGTGVRAQTHATIEARDAVDTTKILRDRIQQILKEARLRDGKAGVAVQDVQSGRMIAAIDDESLCSIASNVKLISSWAALSILGPEYRFRTALFLPGGSRTARKTAGTLYVKGYGDPSLSTSDLDAMASMLRERGVTAIDAVAVDGSYFDEQILPPLFETRSTDAWYRQAIHAVSLNENNVWVQVIADDKPGKNVQVRIRPSSRYFKIKNEALIVGKKRRSQLSISVQSSGEFTEILVQGQVRQNYTGQWIRRRIGDPDLFAAYTLIEALERHGIRVKQHTVKREVTPSEAKPILVYTSEPLAVILRRMNKASSNFVAEQVLKVLGAERQGPPGTFAAGLQATEDALATIGIEKGRYQLKNGSGLYEASQFSAKQLVTVLRAAYLDFRFSAEYISSLAISGIDGTLVSRLGRNTVKGYIRGKTGTLDQVVSLSGYVGSPSKKGVLAFSILLTNLPPGYVDRGRVVADRIALAIADYLESR